MKRTAPKLVGAAPGGNFKQRLVNNYNSRMENIRHTPEPDNSLGVWTLIAMTLLLGGIAWRFGGFGDAFSNLHNLVTGNVGAITRGGNIVPESLAVICLMLGFSIVSAWVVSLFAGKTQGEHAIAKELSKQSAGTMFGNLFFVVTLEELFARVLFLGLFTLIPSLNGVAGFYAMFLLGNFLWAAVHLINFADKRDRSLIRVLPQFVGGVCITMIYVKYGFWTALFVHLGFDALLFGVHKVEKITRYDVVLVLYSAVLAAVSFILMDKPLGDLAPWFSGGLQTFHIEGWGFWDYLKAHVFLSSMFTVGAGLLLLDRPYTSSKAKNVGTGLISMAAISVLAVAVLFGAYWLTGFLTHSMSIRTAMVGLLFAVMQRGRSGSSVARTFFVSIPTTFITICTLEAVGFWPAVLIVLIEQLCRLPQKAIEKIAEAEDTQVIVEEQGDK